jgi:hypothetical protein
LTRGLSALFWGLPLTLIVSVQALTLSWLGAFGPFSHLAPPVAFGLLLYGLALLGRFRRNDLAWRATLDRARFLNLTALGLSPFLHWYQRLPSTELFATAVGLLIVFSLAFLLTLSHVLRHLASLLPNELVRAEAVALSRVTTFCLILLPAAVIAWIILLRWSNPPVPIRLLIFWIDPFRLFGLFFLTILPLSITMLLLWKLKETALETALDPSAAPPRQDAESP